MNEFTDEYFSLAHAIVKQALTDYKNTLRKAKKMKDATMRRMEFDKAKHLKEWFYSQWAMELGVPEDPSYLLKLAEELPYKRNRTKTRAKHH